MQNGYKQSAVSSCRAANHRASIVLIHSALKPNGAKGEEGIYRPIHVQHQFIHLLFIEGAQHVVDLLAFAIVVAYSKPQTGILLCLDDLLDVFQPVVATGRPLWLEPYFAIRQSDIVCDNQQVLFGYFVLVHPVVYCFSTEVHIGGGLHQVDASALVLELRDEGMPIVLKLQALLIGQAIQHQKANVVAGELVFGAYVAQSGY